MTFRDVMIINYCIFQYTHIFWNMGLLIPNIVIIFYSFFFKLFMLTVCFINWQCSIPHQVHQVISDLLSVFKNILKIS